MMKRILTIGMVLAVGFAFAADETPAKTDATTKTAATAATSTQASAKTSGAKTSQKKYLSLAKARSYIAKVIANPKVVTTIMKALAPADQLTFLAELNAAIEKMPGSNEERTATYLNVTRAALKGAQGSGNLANMVAEVFATVPPPVLTVLNERLAEDVFNRSASSATTYTDAEFINIAQQVMKVVNARVAKVDNSDVRSGFAALMFIRASNTASQEIVDALVATLPESAQNTAKTEWIPAAMAEGASQTYEPMIGMTDTGDTIPMSDRVLRIAGPQNFDSLLADLIGGSVDPVEAQGDLMPVVDAIQNKINQELPNGGTGDAFGEVNQQINAIEEGTRGDNGKTTGGGDEPGGYQWQTR